MSNRKYIFMSGPLSSNVTLLANPFGHRFHWDFRQHKLHTGCEQQLFHYKRVKWGHLKTWRKTPLQKPPELASFRKPFQTFRYVWVFAFEDEAQPIYDQAGKFASTNEVEKVISKWCYKHIIPLNKPHQTPLLRRLIHEIRVDWSGWRISSKPSYISCNPDKT